VRHPRHVHYFDYLRVQRALARDVPGRQKPGELPGTAGGNHNVVDLVFLPAIGKEKCQYFVMYMSNYSGQSANSVGIWETRNTYMTSAASSRDISGAQ